jgi:hypothetical protein
LDLVVLVENIAYFPSGFDEKQGEGNKQTNTPFEQKLDLFPPDY